MVLRQAHRALGAVLGLVLLTFSAQAALAKGKRLAFVIGIDQYSQWGEQARLASAVRDAQSIAETLRSGPLRFDVTVLVDDPYRLKIHNAWQDFLDKIENEDTVVFFFAGHGMQSRYGDELMWPSDFPRKFKTNQSSALWEMRSFSFALKNVINDVSHRQPRLSLFIVDACRNNPLVASSTRSPTLEPQPSEPASTGGNSFVLYSASFNERALDGNPADPASRNSLFTAELLPLLKRTDLPLIEIARTVQRSVHEKAWKHEKHQQTPTYNQDRRGGELCLAGSCVVATAARVANAPAAVPAAVPMSEPAQVWSKLEHSSNVQALRSFIHQYPATVQAELARERLDQLGSGTGGSSRRARSAGGGCANGLAVQVSSTNAVTCVEPYHEWFVDCPDCPRMVILPGGTFMMGSPPGEHGRDDDEGPQHMVTIPRPFAIGQLEVTVQNWQRCVDQGACPALEVTARDAAVVEKAKGLFGRGLRRHPIQGVSWQAASGYVAWLARVTGKRYRLPSETEWEYAARAGSTAPFAGHDTPNTRWANYDASSSFAGASLVDQSRDGTVATGWLRANAFGLHDMHGNVWEWVEDCYHDGYTAKPDAVRDSGRAWVRKDCGMRVMRGGDFASRPYEIRAANRRAAVATEALAGAGLRVARDLD